jgi:aminopeptidase-like protein
VSLRLIEHARAGATNIGADMLALIRDLYPLPRSITGAGLRATVNRLAKLIPLDISEVATGTQVFDWTVPNEWTIDDAYIEHESGKRFAQLSESNLHVVNYSAPVDLTLSLDQLKPHLHSLPEHPDWIPYRNSYYSPAWGFCMADRELQRLPPGNYRVVIRSQLAPGSLTLAEHVHRGATGEEVLIFSHDCHPSLANDNLSGIVVAAYLAKQLESVETRYTYRFVFAPATIGSITWLATNQAVLPRIRHGLVLSLLGNVGPLYYKKTRASQCSIDHAASHVLRNGFPGSQVLSFSPWGYDERQFCSPGIDLPVGCLSRSPDANLPENHTSADHPDAIHAESLSEAWLACLEIFQTLEESLYYENLHPHGEPQLSRRGLYRTTGGYYTHVPDRQMALLWTLNLSDGTASILDIAERSNLPLDVVAAAARDLENAGLLRQQVAR